MEAGSNARSDDKKHAGFLISTPKTFSTFFLLLFCANMKISENLVE